MDDDELRVGGLVTNIKGGGESLGINASDFVLEDGERRRDNTIVKTVRMETDPLPRLQPAMRKDGARY